MSEQKGDKTRAKRPTAKKRDIQNEKKRVINQAFKKRIKTALRRYAEALQEGNQADSQEKLRGVYSMMDKGVKRGIFKQNKALRLKSRMALRLQKAAKA